MKRKELLKAPPCPAPGETDEEITAVCQILTQGGKEILDIDLFKGEQLAARYFADRESGTRWTFVKGKWRRSNLNNIARLCLGKEQDKGMYCHGNAYGYSSLRDRKTAEEYLGQSVRWWESDTNQEKREMAEERKQARVNEKMKRYDALPDGFEEWLNSTVFPEEYLFFEKTGREKTYACTVCGMKGKTREKLANGKQTVCPHCGKTVTAYSRAQSRESVNVPVIVLQAFEGEWAERQLRASCRWSGGRKSLSVMEDIRVIIPKGSRTGTVWYGQIHKSPAGSQVFSRKNPLNRRIVASHLYPDVQDALRLGGLEHSGLEEAAQRGEKLQVNGCILQIADKPYIEYLLKSGLIRLANEILEGHVRRMEDTVLIPWGKSLSGLLQIDGNRVARLKEMDGGLAALGWLQWEEESPGRKISRESLDYLQRKNIRRADCGIIIQTARSANRMVNYLKKQRESAGQAMILWSDYLSMAREEGMDLTDDIVRFPKNLRERHDQLTAGRNEKRAEKQAEKYGRIDEKIRKRLPEAERYRWEDEDYVITPAENCAQLIMEGRTLHHCVGASDTYMLRMAAGASWILFLRRKETPDIPYYTLEINMEEDRILQWYSEYDRRPDAVNIKKTLDRFGDSMRRKRQQAAGKEGRHAV